MKKNLFDNDDIEINENIKLNTDYAKRYESWRRKEELNKFKSRYGDEENETSSTSEEEDEDGNELTEEIEEKFFKTLSCLKNRDPRIYDEKVQFFSENDKQNSNKKVKDKSKPMFLRDYERNLLLKTGGNIDDVTENIETPSSPTYVEEQQEIKESFKKALLNDENDSDIEWGGMFQKRKKTKEEESNEERDYKKWLKGNKDRLEDSNTENELKPLKDYWSDPKLNPKESFLRDYILNKKFLDKEDVNYIPSYEQIIHDSDNGLSDDEKAIEDQEVFEAKYNYRFEEPDQEFIKRYPRTMANSVRKKNDKRKQKRAEIKARKEAEKLQKKEELQQLKALKRKEIQEKIEKLKEITGNTDVGFKDEDIDGDFDPEEHDKCMERLFNEEFYQGEEGDQKPEFPDIDKELGIENWDKWDKSKSSNEENAYNIDSYEPHCEDEDFNMDCEYDPSVPSTSSVKKEKRKNRHKKIKFVEEVLEKKTFNPDEKTYEEYLDEYYKLEYEDLIGDLPCRFKYRKVVPNSFGLTIEEILLAKEKELNRWCSLKKAVQIRPEHVEKYDIIAFEKKAQNLELKKKILKSLYENSEDENSQDGSHEDKQNMNINSVNSSKKMNKKNNLKEPCEDLLEEYTSANKQQQKYNEKKVKNNLHEISKRKKSDLVKSKHLTKNSRSKKIQKFKNTPTGDMNITDQRLKAYGLNPKKYKNKIKYGK